jgi:hypothetical protein
MSRPQFSLRALFGLTLLVAVFLAGLAVGRRQADEATRLAELERARAMEAEMKTRAVAEQLAAIRARAKDQDDHP